MGIQHVVFGYHFHQLVFHRPHGFTLGQAGAVGEAENMGVHRHHRLFKDGVKHHIGCFAADTGQGFQRRSLGRDLTLMLFQ